jgi:hypothetical protein
MAKVLRISGGGGTTTNVDATARTSAAAAVAQAAANKSKLDQISPKLDATYPAPGVDVAGNAEVFIEVENGKYLNYKAPAGGAKVPATKTDAAVKAAGFAPLIAVPTNGNGARFLGTATTYLGLPEAAPGKLAPVDTDVSFLLEDEVGNGTSANPQYPRGLYVRTGGVWVFRVSISFSQRAGIVAGRSVTFQGLPQSGADGRSIRTGDLAFLQADDLGSGTVAAPQYPRGFYRWVGASYDLFLALPVFVQQQQSQTVVQGGVQQQPAAPILRVNVRSIDQASDSEIASEAAVRRELDALKPASDWFQIGSNSLYQRRLAGDVLKSLSFEFSDPDDSAVTAQFSLTDFVTGFEDSGYYGAPAKFTNVVMGARTVIVAVIKHPQGGLAINVMNSDASKLGRVRNVLINGMSGAEAMLLPADAAPQFMELTGRTADGSGAGVSGLTTVSYKVPYGYRLHDYTVEVEASGGGGNWYKENFNPVGDSAFRFRVRRNQQNIYIQTVPDATVQSLMNAQPYRIGLMFVKK